MIVKTEELGLIRVVPVEYLSRDSPSKMTFNLPSVSDTVIKTMLDHRARREMTLPCFVYDIQ